MTIAKKAVIPMATRSEIESGPSQKLVKVIKTIMREGVKTPANLLAMFLFMLTLITS